MIAIMGFLVGVGFVMSAAAFIGETGLRRAGVPTRWLWLAAMAAPFVLLALPAVLPAGVETAVGRMTGSVMFELAPLVVGPGGGWPWLGSLGTLLAGAWVLSSLGFAALLARTHRTLLAERSAWPASEVAGRQVYLSPDRGPAVAGLLRPWIVLPSWALSLAADELDMIVLHEEEHARAGDALLLTAALALLALVPWSPVAWLQLRMLRTAMEVDCDRRVLRQVPDAERYGNSLLSVAARASGHTLGLAAFTERSHSLETRILAMTARSSRWTPLRAALLVLLALVVGVQACAIESPVAVEGTTADGRHRLFPGGPEAQPAARSVEELRHEPTFTPFTNAPSITNREEVIEAMIREYPPLLRDAGVGGTVNVYFFIDEEGRVANLQINESSGHPALDEAALAVAGVYAFEPARHGDEKVPVWVSFPITFQAR